MAQVAVEADRRVALAVAVDGGQADGDARALVVGALEGGGEAVEGEGGGYLDRGEAVAQIAGAAVVAGLRGRGVGGGGVGGAGRAGHELGFEQVGGGGDGLGG